MRITAILTLVLFATTAHATGFGSRMLRDAETFHDEQRIKSLIDKEVLAEDRGDAKALNKAILSLSKATDPSARN